MHFGERTTTIPINTPPLFHDLAIFGYGNIFPEGMSGSETAKSPAQLTLCRAFKLI